MKICPDMTTVAWEKAIMRGMGDYQRVVLKQCVMEQCAAYDDGFCKKYGQTIFETEEEREKVQERIKQYREKEKRKDETEH